MSEGLNKLNNNTIVNRSPRFRFKTSNILKREALRKESFILWLKLNSVRKACDELNSRGWRNNNGNPYSEGSVRLYAEDFLLYNPIEARKLYQEYGMFLNGDDGDEEWVEYVIHMAVRKFVGKKKFLRWAVDNGFYKSGFHVFQHTYNLKDEDRDLFD